MKVAGRKALLAVDNCIEFRITSFKDLFLQLFIADENDSANKFGMFSQIVAYAGLELLSAVIVIAADFRKKAGHMLGVPLKGPLIGRNRIKLLRGQTVDDGLCVECATKISSHFKSDKMRVCKGIAQKPRILLSYQKAGSTSKLLTATPSFGLFSPTTTAVPRIENASGTDNWMLAQACDRVIFTRCFSYIVLIERF